MEISQIAPLRLLAGLFIVPLIALTVAACGGSDEDSSSNGNDGSEMVGGMVDCDRSSIQQGVDAWSRAYGGGEKTTLPEGSDSYKCADGWAVAFPNSGTGNGEVTVTVVLEAEGQFWIPKDRAKVCGDSAADSDVPESLYREACQTN